MNRGLAAMDAKAARPDGMHDTVRLRPTGVDSGYGIEGRVLLASGSQINVISRGMFLSCKRSTP